MARGKLPAPQEEAVSPTLAVILMVAVLVVISVAVVVFVDQFTETRDAPQQKATFQAQPHDGIPGGRVQVVSVPGGPLDWSQMRLGGTATCTMPDGPIDAGDAIVCTTSGTVSLVDTRDGALLYLGEFR